MLTFVRDAAGTMLGACALKAKDVDQALEEFCRRGMTLPEPDGVSTGTASDALLQGLEAVQGLEGADAGSLVGTAAGRAPGAAVFAGVLYGALRGVPLFDYEISWLELAWVAERLALDALALDGRAEFDHTLPIRYGLV